MAIRHRCLRDIAIGLATIVIGATGASTAIAAAAAVPACRSTQLRTVAYGAGLAAGTEYLAITVTNRSSRACRVGSTVALMRSDGHRFRWLASEATTPIFDDHPVAVLRPGERAVAQVATTWAVEERGNADCPEGSPHPLDRVSAIKLNTGTLSMVTNPFDVERCLRRVGTLTGDKWLTECEHRELSVCRPIPVSTHRQQIG
jgi:Protein of unknown function (DUF4232)